MSWQLIAILYVGIIGATFIVLSYYSLKHAYSLSRYQDDLLWDAIRSVIWPVFLPANLIIWLADEITTYIWDRWKRKVDQ